MAILQQPDDDVLEEVETFLQALIDRDGHGGYFNKDELQAAQRVISHYICNTVADDEGEQ